MTEKLHRYKPGQGLRKKLGLRSELCAQPWLGSDFQNFLWIGVWV